MPPWKLCPECQKGIFVEAKQEVSKDKDDRPIDVRHWLYSCGHAWTVSMIPDPVSILDNAIANKNWFEGLVMASALFESLAVRAILKHLKSKKRPISRKKIERLTLSELLLFLYGSGLIDQKTYSEMVEVKQKRDSLVHYVKPIYQIRENEARQLLCKAKNAIDCLSRTSIIRE